MVHKALAAAEELNKEGLNLRVIDIHTIKPIDEKLLVKAAEETGALVTAEDHNIIGGLGGAVSEVLSTRIPVPVEIIGVQDCFGESGDPEELFTEYCMNTEHIAEAVKRVVKRK